MATPVIESIGANLATDIDAITTGNGFEYTLNAVRSRRLMYADTPWADLDVIIIQQDETSRYDPGANDAAPTDCTTIDQNFQLTAIGIDSDSETDSVDTKLNKIAADIIKKLLADGTRGGNAIDTTILNSEPAEIAETISGITINIEVRYRVKYGDPYTNRST